MDRTLRKPLVELQIEYSLYKVGIEVQRGHSLGETSFLLDGLDSKSLI